MLAEYRLAADLIRKCQLTLTALLFCSRFVDKICSYNKTVNWQKSSRLCYFTYVFKLSLLMLLLLKNFFK